MCMRRSSFISVRVPCLPTDVSLQHHFLTVHIAAGVCRYILMLGGNLTIGTTAAPWPANLTATITMSGTPASIELPLYGAKVCNSRGFYLSRLPPALAVCFALLLYWTRHAMATVSTKSSLGMSCLSQVAISNHRADSSDHPLSYVWSWLRRSVYV